MRAPVGHFERHKEDLNGRVRRLGGLLLILLTSHIRQCIALVEAPAVRGVWEGVFFWWSGCWFCCLVRYRIFVWALCVVAAEDSGLGACAPT